jgi:hypothetical protein
VDADKATAASLESELRDRLSTLRSEAARIAASVARHSEEAALQLEAAASAEQHDVLERKLTTLLAAEGQRSSDERSATATLTSAVAAIAPGAASLPWSDQWPSAPLRPAGYLRFGHMVAGVPAVAPFLEHQGWALFGDERSAVDLMKQVVLRTTAQVSLRHLRIRVFDPRIEGPLGFLSDVRDASPSFYPAPAHNTDDLRDLLGEVTRLASSAAELISARHVRSLGELWQDEGRAVHPYTVLAVLGYPQGIDEAAQAALIRLARSGSTRGVSLLVQVDTSVRPVRDVHPADLIGMLLPFTAAEGRWQCPALPAGAVVDADPLPSREQVKAVLARAVREVRADTGPTVPLGDLLAPYVIDPWQETAEDGVEALIGRRGDDPVRLVLRSENPPHPNLLIGGAVGQGKSNLLLTIIYSLAVRYGPDELEMLLLDFKQGLEFKRFDKDADGRNWLPHAKVIGLESSKPFGLAVLEFVLAEKERRSELFKEARCNGFREYRQKTGKSMPRLLLVIDEFQVLFDGHDDLTTTAVLLFEELARQGRGYGIHCLLSSQTVSGISGFQVKGDSIFAQFPLRVSLKNTAEESQAILARGNTAAADLVYRGEVVVNRDFGRTPANELAVAGYAAPDWISGLQQQLWEKDIQRREPWVFVGNGFAQWPRSLAAAEVPTARIGRPIEVTGDVVEIPFRNDVDQAVALVGTGDVEATAVLTAVVDTATADWTAGERVIVLDGRPPGGTDPFSGDVLNRVRARGVDVQTVRGEAIPDYLINDLAATMRTNATSTLVVALHLQRLTSMGDEKLVDPDDEYGSRSSGASALQELSSYGSACGIHLIGWWPNLRSVKTHLGFDLGGVSRFIFLKVGLDDLREVAGPQAVSAEGSPRVQLFDRGSGDALEVVVPFEPVRGEAG